MRETNADGAQYGQKFLTVCPSMNTRMILVPTCKVVRLNGRARRAKGGSGQTISVWRTQDATRTTYSSRPQYEAVQCVLVWRFDVWCVPCTVYPYFSLPLQVRPITRGDNQTHLHESHDVFIITSSLFIRASKACCGIPAGKLPKSLPVIVMILSDSKSNLYLYLPHLGSQEMPKRLGQIWVA